MLARPAGVEALYSALAMAMAVVMRGQTDQDAVGRADELVQVEHLRRRLNGRRRSVIIGRASVTACGRW
jgi:hypothetical protein